MFRVAFDTGGTFTDGLLTDEQGHITVSKVPTTPENPSEGIMNLLTVIGQERGLSLKELLSKTSTIIAATTLGTNAILMLKGARVCMITTRGFRDIIEFRRVVKPDLYNMEMPAPTILVPRYLRFEAEERIRVNGTIITPLNENEVRIAARKAKSQNAEVVAVCFLHSYINPKHEQRAAEIVREEYPEVEIVLSSNILPRPSEFERFSTTVLAGYVKPVSSAFIRTFEDRLNKAGFKGNSLYMTTNAAITTPEVAMELPNLLLGSGPSAGPLMATYLGKSCGFEDIIACDMGGPSFEISVIPRGRIIITTEGMIGDQRNATESVDVSSIGAGGGSIAWIDQRGILRVGPESAGASPGPACYGKGGKRPTVTDADVILGNISPDYFLAGKMKLDKSLAEKAIKKVIAEPMGMDVLEAAYSIRALADFIMAERVFMAAVDRGYDPRKFILCLGGGAGPTHGVSIASRLGIKSVYVPKLAPVYCASGMLSADFRHIYTRGAGFLGDKVDLNEMNKLYAQMEENGINLLSKEGVPPETMRIKRGAEMRYYGQIHDCEAELQEVGLNTPVNHQSFDLLINDFHENHRKIYGYSDNKAPTQITTLKLTAIGKREPVRLLQQPISSEDPSSALKYRRPVFFNKEEGFVETSCYDGDKLRHGNVIQGPAIIEEKLTTVVIPPGATVRVDAYGNYLISM